MKGVNEVRIIGNLGQEPEVKYTGSGTPVASLSVATNESWTNAQGEKVEHVEWHRVILWRRLAEVAGEYLKKGAPVYIEGKLQTRSWDKEGGAKGYVTEIIGSRLIMLGQKNGGGVPAPMDDNAPDPRGSAAPVDRGTEITDEDVPF